MSLMSDSRSLLCKQLRRIINILQEQSSTADHKLLSVITEFYQICSQRKIDVSHVKKLFYESCSIPIDPNIKPELKLAFFYFIQMIHADCAEVAEILAAHDTEQREGDSAAEHNSDMPAGQNNMPALFRDMLVEWKASAERVRDWIKTFRSNSPID